MTPSRTGSVVRRAGVAAATIAAAVALVGCGGSDGTSGSPETSASPSMSASTDAEPKAVEVNGAQLEVPSNWSVKGGGLRRAKLSVPADETGTSYGTAVFNADMTMAADTEALAEVRANAAGGDAKRLPDVEFGGQLFFHLRELHGGVDSLDTYGTVIDGSEVTVAWGFNAKLASREQIDDWIDEVMSTFEFTG